MSLVNRIHDGNDNNGLDFGNYVLYKQNKVFNVLKHGGVLAESYSQVTIVSNNGVTR